MPQEPLLYSERLPQVRRSFRLFDDRVEIEAAWTFGRRFTHIVSLKDLSPQTQRFLIRNRWFKRALLVASLAVGTAVVFGRPGYHPHLQRAAGFGWIVAGFALVVAVATFRKRQFTHFPRKDGKPGLDLCRLDAAAHDAFEKQVRMRIAKA